MEELDELIIDDEELEKLVEEYKKAKGNDFFVFPLKDRIKLFLAFIKDSNYKKSSFDEIDDFKLLFFSKEELEKINIFNINNHLMTFIIGDKLSRENKLIVLFSEKGVKKDQELNASNTCAFEISFKDHSAKKIGITDLKTNIVNKTYIVRDFSCKQLGNDVNKLEKTVQNENSDKILDKKQSVEKTVQDEKKQVENDSKELNAAFETYLGASICKQA